MNQSTAEPKLFATLLVPDDLESGVDLDLAATACRVIVDLFSPLERLGHSVPVKIKQLRLQQRGHFDAWLIFQGQARPVDAAGKQKITAATELLEHRTHQHVFVISYS